MEPFRVEIRDRARGPVRIWSAFPVPFEPKGEALRLRTAIRDAVSGLCAGPGDVLQGRLHADAGRGAAFDAENVLFYNIGASFFARARNAGLAWESSPRRFQPPGPPDLPVCVEYEVLAAEPPSHWVRTEPVVFFDGVRIPVVGAKPTPLWRALHDSSAVRVVGEAITEGPFGIDLTLGVPDPAAVRPITIVKPLVDGLVAAFHVHDGRNEEALAAVLGRELSEDPGVVLGRLRNRARAVLGERSLLHSRAQGVQWNPGDDRCQVAWLRTTRSDSAFWRLSGTLFPVRPARD